MRICSVEWCEREVKHLEFCDMHYQRQRHGIDMNKPPKRRYSPQDKCDHMGCESGAGRGLGATATCIGVVLARV